MKIVLGYLALAVMYVIVMVGIGIIIYKLTERKP